MANFYTDKPQLRYHLNHPLMKRIVELKERNFSDKENYDYAPMDHEDAMDSYDRVLEVVGEICGDIIAPNAEAADAVGPTVENGRVVYGKETLENLDAVRKAGLMGMALPRRFGGLNFPVTPYIMAAELVSRADAGFENLWGLQDCAETLFEYGSVEQHEQFLPRVAVDGQTMSMDLTEPDAGSDLQAVMLKATLDEATGQWYLNGVKRFITNGDSDIHLVLARSEEGSTDARGLSMFIYDSRDGGVTVRRIEHKMGIKSVPACELVFNNAKAQLCGDRRMGLIKYVMGLMNGARLGIMAQSVGISEAAYEEAVKYAEERKQFGKSINHFPAVYEMLALMRAKTDASRCHLYETTCFVDIYKTLMDIQRERKLTPEERSEMKKYNRLADAFTPLGKGVSSEFANQNVYDCLQVHGGSGFMKDYTCERLYRDVRITNIYEGTTQLQVIAAIRHVTTGTYVEQLKAYQAEQLDDQWRTMMDQVSPWADLLASLTEKVLEHKNQEVTDFLARRLVEVAAHALFTHELIIAANGAPEHYATSAKVYYQYAKNEIAKHQTYIEEFDPSTIELFNQYNHLEE